MIPDQVGASRSRIINIDMFGVYAENPAIANKKQQTGKLQQLDGCACIVFSARISHIFLPAALLFIFVNHNASQHSKLTKSSSMFDFLLKSHLIAQDLVSFKIINTNGKRAVSRSGRSVCIQEDYAIKTSPKIFISVKTL